jgi:hypothetical protein
MKHNKSNQFSQQIHRNRMMHPDLLVEFNACGCILSCKGQFTTNIIHMIIKSCREYKAENWAYIDPSIYQRWDQVPRNWAYIDPSIYQRWDQVPRNWAYIDTSIYQRWGQDSSGA